MWKRYLWYLISASAALVLLTSFSLEARAQPMFSGPPPADPAGDLAQVQALLTRSFVPVQIYEVEGPSTLQAGEEGLFVARVNIESATLPLQGRWDFGDGQAGAGLHVRHRFAEAGTYGVVFTVRNARSEASDTLTVQVLPATDAAVVRGDARPAAMEDGR